jgi:phospholipase C
MKFLTILSLIASKVIEINDSDPSNAEITNIVVLMMENRSFDSFLGRLEADGLNPEINGISKRLVNYVDNLQVGTRNVDQKMDLGFDPGHDVSDITEQIYGRGYFDGVVKGKEPKMNGFAENVVRNAKNRKILLPECFQEVFGLHGPESLPVTYALAQEFSVIDDWFASVPGPTYPNRHFLQCATALGKMGNDLNYVTGLKCKTVFENLDEKDISWKVYRDGLISSTSIYSYFRNPKNHFKVKGFNKFKQDARMGDLPQYSFIDPDFLKSTLEPDA